MSTAGQGSRMPPREPVRTGRPPRVAEDDRLFHYACQFLAVAEATRQSFTASRPATESSLLVPALSVSDVSPPHGSDWAALARTSDLLFNERGKVHG